MKDVIEYYAVDGENLVCTVQSNMVPTVGSFINISGKTWKVINVTYTVDHSDNQLKKHMRANVDLTSKF